jgi:hypothetical protein
MSWNPVEKPFRVHFTRNGSYYGRYCSRAYTFATRDEAAAFLKEQLPREPKGVKAHLMRAVNTDSWAKHGRFEDA